MTLPIQFNSKHYSKLFFPENSIKKLIQNSNPRYQTGPGATSISDGTFYLGQHDLLLGNYDIHLGQQDHGLFRASEIESQGLKMHLSCA